jgi:hypothetical protein
VNEKNTLTANLQTKDAEITALKAQLKTFETAKITNLIDGAIAEKKISEDERETYTKLAESDFEGVEKIINKMQGVDPITAKLNQPAKTGEAWNKRNEEINKKGA